MILKEVIEELLDDGIIDCSSQAIQCQISSGLFAGFDDHFIITKVRDLRAQLESENDSARRLKIDALLNRNPPKLVATAEWLANRGAEEQRSHRNLEKQLRDKIPKWADQFKIDRQHWYPWQKAAILSKVGAHLPADEPYAFEEEAQQAVRILIDEPSATAIRSKFLVSNAAALISRLADLRLYYIRLYLLLPPGNEGREIAKAVETQIRADLPDFPWAYSD
jgi:hypothetical protein